MRPEDMDLTRIGDLTLETFSTGSGDPILFVHGAMGDECAAVLAEPALAEHYRLIHFHRRGWGRSDLGEDTLTPELQAADCQAVLRHFGVESAHCVGQSGGGVMVLQLALQAPEAVRSLTVLEPALASVLLASPEFGGLAQKVTSLYDSGDPAGALKTFAVGVCGEGYRAVFDRTLPSGYLERWVADADTALRDDNPQILKWEFTREDAARITQPVLNVVGANTWAPFREIYETVQAWIPHAENHELPDASHGMLQMNPKGAAERIARFISSH